jgi:hypothetical protein
MKYSAGTGLELILLFRTILDLFYDVMTAGRRSLYRIISKAGNIEAIWWSKF